MQEESEKEQNRAARFVIRNYTSVEGSMITSVEGSMIGFLEQLVGISREKKDG